MAVYTNKKHSKKGEKMNRDLDWALVKTIQSDTNEAVVAMERSTTDVVGGSLLAENAGAALVVASWSPAGWIGSGGANPASAVAATIGAAIGNGPVMSAVDAYPVDMEAALVV